MIYLFFVFICRFLDLIDMAIKPQEILTSPQYESTEYTVYLQRFVDYCIKIVKKLCSVKT